MHYDAPWAAWVVMGVVVVALLSRWLSSWRRKVVAQFGSAPMVLPSKRGRRWAFTCLLFGWVAASLALMCPKGSPHPLRAGEMTTLSEEVTHTDDEVGHRIARRKAHDVIFLLDASLSMSVADTRLEQSRLDYAKEVIDEIVGGLDGQTAALYAFTSELTPVVPATVDYLYTRLVLRRVGLNEGDVAGTDLVEALEGIGRRHKADKRTLVLLTDGGDTRLESVSGQEREQQLTALLSRLDEKTRPICIGLGSAQGEVIPDLQFEGKPVIASLDEELLKRLADHGRGSYYFANSYSTLSLAQAVLAEIKDNEMGYDEEIATKKVDLERTTLEEAEIEYNRYFQLPLLGAILALGAMLILRAR